jgi:hypothetical protein
MRRAPNVIDGRRTRAKTHYQVGVRALCGQHRGHRMTMNHDRVDCRRCLSYPQPVMPSAQARIRISREGGRVVESPVVQYRAGIGEFVYIGPLSAVAGLLVKDRVYWSACTPEGEWTVALCEGPGEVFIEVGQSTDHNEALRIAIAAYLTPTQEWRIAEEVMW